MPLLGYASLCEDRQKTIVSKDHGAARKHIANNVKLALVAHYRIDGVIITEKKRCDFLVLNEGASTAYLIELKGSDLNRAIEQLSNTEHVLKEKLKSYTLFFRIVASKSKTHQIESTEFRKFKIAKGKHFKYATNTLEEEI